MLQLSEGTPGKVWYPGDSVMKSTTLESAQLFRNIKSKGDIPAFDQNS